MLTLSFVILPQTVYILWTLTELLIFQIGEVKLKYDQWRRKRKKNNNGTKKPPKRNSSLKPNIYWPDFVISFPGLHLIKRVKNFCALIAADFDSEVSSNPELEQVVKQSEEDKLYGLVFHSAPQLILQSAISIRLNHTVTVFQKMSLFWSFMTVVQCTTSLFFTQRSPQSVRLVYGLRRLPVMTTMFLMTLSRSASWALIFSYAKTFMTVPVIVLFGITNMYIYYSQGHLTKHRGRFYIIALSASFVTPCVVGLGEDSFIFLTTIATGGLHLISHLLLFFHVIYLMDLSVKILPLELHCIPAPISEEISCLVKNATITSECRLTPAICDMSRCDTYATLCPENTWPHHNFVIRSTTTIVGIIFSFLLAYALQYFANYDRLDRFVRIITSPLTRLCCKKSDRASTPGDSQLPQGSIQHENNVNTEVETSTDTTP